LPRPTILGGVQVTGSLIGGRGCAADLNVILVVVYGLIQEVVNLMTVVGVVVTKFSNIKIF
jgi:hypothetical protein